MKSKLNLVNGNRIGSWEGTDVIFTTQKDYENFSDEEIKNKIYAFSVYNCFDDITNIYMVKNDTVFAYLLNEFGEIKEVLDICKKKLKSLESVYNQDIEFSKLEYELYNSIENFNNKNK